MKSYVCKLFTIWYKSYLGPVETLWRDLFFILPGKIVKVFVNTTLNWSTDLAFRQFDRKTASEALRLTEVSWVYMSVADLGKGLGGPARLVSPPLSLRSGSATEYVFEVWAKLNTNEK